MGTHLFETLGPNDREDAAAAPGEPHGSGVTNSFVSLLLKKY